MVKHLLGAKERSLARFIFSKGLYGKKVLTGLKILFAGTQT